jgi:hypothetical protein
MPRDGRAGSVLDLFTENAGLGTLAMDAACNDRDWIPARAMTRTTTYSGCSRSMSRSG